MTAIPASSTRARVLPELLIWGGVAATAFGFVHGWLWRDLPLERVAETLLLAGLAALMAWPLRHWRGWSWAGALLVPWSLAVVAMGGVLPVAASLLLVLSGAAAGSLVTGAGRPVLAVLCGWAMLVAVIGWTLPLPIHHWWTHLPCLLLLVAWRRRALATLGSTCATAWRGAVSASPRAAAWTIMLLGLASSATWLPTMQYDDLAYHLGLPWQLMLHGRHDMDPTHQVWALAPWAGDVLQAIPQVLSRQEARGAVNAAWLALTGGILWRAGACIGLTPLMRWATVALFASLPLTAGLLAGMQTETAAAAVTVALATVLLADAPSRDRMLVAVLLTGLLIALKPIHLLAVVPLLLWSGVQSARERRWARPMAWLAAAGAVALVGGGSYFYAGVLAGNPVLPLFNAQFQSPYFAAVDFSDARWHAGWEPALAWRITFRTPEYLEGWRGGFGFLLVGLAGAWLAGLWRRETRTLVALATLAMVLPLAALHYARYLHPGLVLMLPPLALVLQNLLPSKRAAGLVAALCIVNLAFQANSNWILHLGGVKRSLVALGRDAPVLTRYTPERVLIARIREQAPSSGPVMVLSQPAHAELAGRGRTVDWYAPALHAEASRADGDPSGRLWMELLRRERISEVILASEKLEPARQAGLQRLGARREATVGRAEWWHVPGGDRR